MNIISRRSLIGKAGSAALLTAPVLLQACGSQGASDAPTKPVALRPDVTLHLLIEVPAADQPLFKKVLASWKQAQPAAPKVEFGSGTAVQNAEKAQTLLAAGTPPDIIQLEAAGASGFIGKGLLSPLDAFIKRDKYDLSDYFERSYPQYEWKGKKYGIAKGMSNQSLYYNQVLFDQAGLPYPANKPNATGWDFDAFVKASERLTKRNGTDTTQWGFVVERGLRGGWGQWIRANGGEIFDKDFTKCLLGEARAMEALQFMQDLMYKFRVAPTPAEETAAGGAMAMFASQGIVGMRINPVSNIAPHRRATFQWDLAVNPMGGVGKGKRVTTGGGQAWLIIGPSKNQEEAWALVKHVTTLEAVKEMAPIWYPARKSVLSWLMAQDPQLPPKNRHVGPEGQTLLVYDPIFPAYQDIQKDIIVPELTALWNNKQTAAQVVESIVPKVNAALKAQG
ncbi:MAG TPA: extracellular solute-binding protein [Chloroflexota bacterium]|nr:extracellular solute-binding protein [Chloroflexota bacterium]